LIVKEYSTFYNKVQVRSLKIILVRERRSYVMSIAINAPMAGKLVSVDVKVGDKVKKNAEVATLEAMKMFIKVYATAEGTVASIDAEADSNVDPTTVILTLE
jgi:pyruvate carboxylase subunit B